VPPSIALPALMHGGERAPDAARRETPAAERDCARAALGFAPHEFVVAWAGRFDRVKRLHVVVRTAEVLSTIPSRFVLAGDGPQRSAIEQMLRLSGAAGRVLMLGWRADVNPVLAAADAFLFPSRTEGMPNALLEAMARGLACVVSDIPVHRELAGVAAARPGQIAGGQTQPRLVLVRGDQPRDYAAALLRLYERPDERRELGDRAAAWARTELRPDKTVAAVLRVYARVLRR
jgi:glycosyltransferase involved in cell wall biosynthesis